MSFKPKRTIPLIQHNAATEEYKRPDALPFKLASELAPLRWSGVRQNPLTEDIEFWIEGEIVERVTAAAAVMDPLAVTKAHMRVFAFGPDEVAGKAH